MLPLPPSGPAGDIEERVSRYLQLLVAADDSLKSVWLYSWPDARTLIAVAHPVNHTNPLPLGYFLRTDSSTVGELVMEAFASLDRPGKKLLACPIIAENDAWGVVVFEHELDTQRPHNYKSVYVALAHKLANLIYHNHD